MRTEKKGGTSHAQLDGIDANLRFLVHEVRKQVLATSEFLSAPTPTNRENLLSQDDYIDHLKDVILRKCFSLVPRAGEGSSTTVAFLKAIDVVTVNLERIADFCENIVAQTQYVHLDVLSRQNFRPFFTAILDGIDRIATALLNGDSQQAVEICQAEHITDLHYAQELRRLLRELEAGKETESLVTTIFIYRYLERMGDSLLNIGEAILSACLGERIKIDQWKDLEEMLDSSGLSEKSDDVELEPLAETRSGCKVGRVRTGGPSDGSSWVVFKEGRLSKLAAEKAASALWQDVIPGLAPKIHAFHDRGPSGSLLFEYLAGRTFEEHLLRGEARSLGAALNALCRTLARVWEVTQTPTPATPCFVQQLAERMEDVYSLHPVFRSASHGIGSLSLPSFDGLLEQARALDQTLACPFSVLTHGDFNVDNVIYSEDGDRIHFVDLHRSRPGDYLQDVSVFLVSNHRLHVFDEPIRQRIRDTIAVFHDFARDTGSRLGDQSFAPRLALGLARSFATSTRFILDYEFAKSMFLRARYLLEAVLSTPAAALNDFEIPREILIDD